MSFFKILYTYVAIYIDTLKIDNSIHNCKEKTCSCTVKDTTILLKNENNMINTKTMIFKIIFSYYCNCCVADFTASIPSFA